MGPGSEHQRPAALRLGEKQSNPDSSDDREPRCCHAQPHTGGLPLSGRYADRRKEGRFRLIEHEGYSNFRICVSETPAPELTLSPLNPVLPEIPKKFTKTDLEQLRDFFEN